MVKRIGNPPPWIDIWVCPFADGHIQATVGNAKGWKQVRCYARFREVRENTKYEHVPFADALREKGHEVMAL